MATARLQGRRGDGSAVVRGWVALYTLGLPSQMRTRRRDEVAGDLADETLDAVRRGEVSDLRRRRLIRWVFGIPADLVWRFLDAPATARMVRARRPPLPWVPVSKRSTAMLAIVAIGTAGALGIVSVPVLTGQARPDTWLGWGLAGFVISCVAILIGVLASVPWPRRGLTIVIPGVVIGMVAAPWLVGCWLLALFGVALRAFEAREPDSALPEERPPRRPDGSAR
jgi:hypothetical protein